MSKVIIKLIIVKATEAGEKSNDFDIPKSTKVANNNENED